MQQTCIAHQPWLPARNLCIAPVAGLWWAEAVGGGRTHIEIEPFRPPLARAAAHALEREGERLAELVAPLEPRV